MGSFRIDPHFQIWGGLWKSIPRITKIIGENGGVIVRDIVVL